jgi:hypothetical protein
MWRGAIKLTAILDLFDFSFIPVALKSRHTKAGHVRMGALEISPKTIFSRPAANTDDVVNRLRVARQKRANLAI